MKEVDPKLLSDQIMIIDFGIAFLQDQSSPSIGTPKSYCAPEFLFNDGRSVSSDIWALGCTIFEIRTGCYLFRYKGAPSRNQSLIAMIKVLGTLPEFWWDKWEEGRDWYANAIKTGELSDHLKGSLFSKIMEIGIYDGDVRAGSSSKDESLKHSSEKRASLPEKSSNDTKRLMDLVEAITTSEAAEVLYRVNKSGSDSNNEPKSASGSSSGKEKSGSGSSKSNKTNSGSSNAKSGEKSISSEGVSTGVPASTPPKLPKNLIGAEDIGIAGSAVDATQGVKVFLEPSGSRITLVEAVSLENLLRKALSYMPEQRLCPSELAKHHWFFDDFNIKVVKVVEPMI